jgi:hypothetical protein
MTTITNSSPLASYFANTAKPTTANTAETGSSSEKTSTAAQDPLAEIRRYASGLVANSRGGLLRAMNAESSSASNSIASDRYRAVDEQKTSSDSRITLPDVADMDRDDAAKLLAQVDKLLDAGLESADSFVGYNGDQQTESLSTYRDWLQARGGVSVYV